MQSHRSSVALGGPNKFTDKALLVTQGTHVGGDPDCYRGLVQRPPQTTTGQLQAGAWTPETDPSSATQAVLGNEAWTPLPPGGTQELSSWRLSPSPHPPALQEPAPPASWLPWKPPSSTLLPNRWRQGSHSHTPEGPS